MAHIRQSRPGSGLGFRITVLKTSQVVHVQLSAGAHLTGVVGRAGSEGGESREINSTLIVMNTRAH